MRLRTLLGLLGLAWTSTAHGGPRLEDERASIEFEGRVQAGFTHRFLLEGDDDREDTKFFVRRARFHVKTEVYDQLRTELAIDFMGNGGLPEAKDVYVAWEPTRWAHLRIGQFKTPISGHRLLPAKRLLFIDRPRVVNDFVPGRDIGAMSSLRTVDTRYGLHLGAFTGRGEDVDEDDHRGSPLLAVRMVAMPLARVYPAAGDVEQTGRLAVGLGLNAAWSRDGESLEPGDTAHSIAGDKLLYGGDLTLKYRGFYLTAELLLAAYWPDHGVTWYAGGYLLQASYYIAPLHLEPAVRFDDFNPSDIVPDDRETSLSFGLNAYPRHDHRVKLQVDYTHRLPSGWLTDHAADEGWAESQLNATVQVGFW